MELNAYLLFDGNCEAAFRRYERVLGGRIEALLTYEGSPAAGQVPPHWQKKILHARLTVGDEALMGSDTPPGRYEPMKGFSVTISVQEPQEAERIFNALAEDGTVRMPIGETFWARRFGMLIDQFGTPWMINCGRAE
jgi:PhnB protein